jgi:DNA-directed RNA polymerase subunit M/transcription elongation factor TFIIS
LTLLADTARFRTDDPEELVMASLACPMCLSSAAVEWRLEDEGYDPSVECTCDRCEQTWRVYMTPLQSLRASLISRA